MFKRLREFADCKPEWYNSNWTVQTIQEMKDIWDGKRERNSPNVCVESRVQGVGRKLLPLDSGQRSSGQ